MDYKGSCNKVKGRCSSVDAKDKCLSCAAKYELTNNKCVLKQYNNLYPEYKNCRIWDWNQKVCILCFKQSLDTDNICV